MFTFTIIHTSIHSDNKHKSNEQTANEINSQFIKINDKKVTWISKWNKQTNTTRIKDLFICFFGIIKLQLHLFIVRKILENSL